MLLGLSLLRNIVIFVKLPVTYGHNPLTHVVKHLFICLLPHVNVSKSWRKAPPPSDLLSLTTSFSTLKL